MNSRDAIFIAISQMSHTDLEPFLKSVQRSGCTASIVCFCGQTDDDTIEFLQQRGILIVPMKEHMISLPMMERKLNLFKWAYPLMLVYRQLYILRKRIQGVSAALAAQDFMKYFSRICTMRFFYFREFLQEHFSDFDRILLTDARDVLFQRDPFSTQWENDGVHCFLESDSCSIRNDRWNSYWIRKIGGDELLNTIGSNTISCAGVTFGATPVMMDYMERICTYLGATIDRLDLDQGFHNLMIWNKELKNVHVGHSNKSRVITIGLLDDSELQFNDAGYLVNVDGSVIDIVHQYDRKPFLRERLYRVLGLH